MMNQHISHIQQQLAPLRQTIIHHKVYPQIKDIAQLRIFMRYHVYAVWDFMSLLKTLQNTLTCTDVPWYPKGDAETRFLINEIVVGEESDLDPEGVRKSHFELYVSAMQQIGADTHEILSFVSTIQQGHSLEQAFEIAQTPEAARSFVRSTFAVIGSKKPHVQAAVFTFGREDLIPGMFISLVNDMHQAFPDSVALFKYYLERHIEVDGDHHSHLALQMTELLCKQHPEEYWLECEAACIHALQQRNKLWDGIYQEILG